MYYDYVLSIGSLSSLMAAAIPDPPQLGHTLALLSEGAAGSGCKLLPKSPRAQAYSTLNKVPYAVAYAILYNIIHIFKIESN